MLQDYKKHCEEREKQSIPPLPLSAQQTSDLVELLKAEHKESELLLELLRERVPAGVCLLYTSPSPRDRTRSRMPSSA